MLKRSTARSASAGSRYDALRSRWLSIIPPAVGSGCRQTSVATGSRRGGRASSPTSSRPSAVCSTMFSRRAGRTVPARISTAALLSHERSSLIGGQPPGTGRLLLPAPSPVAGQPRPARPAPPASIVPVPAFGQARSLGRPDHQVRRAWPDLLVAARAAVLLRRCGAWHLPHHPVAVRPLLGPRRSEPGRRVLVPVARVPGRRPAACGRPGAGGAARPRQGGAPSAGSPARVRHPAGRRPPPSWPARPRRHTTPRDRRETRDRRLATRARPAKGRPARTGSSAATARMPGHRNPRAWPGAPRPPSPTPASASSRIGPRG